MRAVTATSRLRNPIERLGRRPGAANVVERARRLGERRGLAAVFLARTVLCPLGPYVGYTSGALGMAWAGFTLTALAGGFLWSLDYAWLGVAFADRIAQIASLMNSSVGVVMAGALAIGGLAWLVSNYRCAQPAF